MNPNELRQIISDKYRQKVAQKHPDRIGAWPWSIDKMDLWTYDNNRWVIARCNFVGGLGKNNSYIDPRGTFSLSDLGGKQPSFLSLEKIKAHLEAKIGCSKHGAFIILDNGDVNSFNTSIDQEVNCVLSKHEYVLGVVPMKIFLSHKGSDKSLVRDFQATLEALKYETWLDNDNMPAGTSLNKGIFQGMQDSCAAVFFITSSFKNETWIAEEAELAKTRKIQSGEKFSIITLILDETAEKNVPPILTSFVYKKPTSHLEALREILRALPITTVGSVRNL
jgi:hypothetical protein